jgi:hypothetical protein
MYYEQGKYFTPNFRRTVKYLYGIWTCTGK